MATAFPRQTCVACSSASTESRSQETGDAVGQESDWPSSSSSWSRPAVGLVWNPRTASPDSGSPFQPERSAQAYHRINGGRDERTQPSWHGRLRHHRHLLQPQSGRGRTLKGWGASPRPTLWFARSLRDAFALSHAGGYQPVKSMLEAELPRTLQQLKVAATPDQLAQIGRPCLGHPGSYPRRISDHFH